MITTHARPRQTDEQTDEHHGNSATIRSMNASRVQKQAIGPDSDMICCCTFTTTSICCFQLFECANKQTELRSISVAYTSTFSHCQTRQHKFLAFSNSFKYVNVPSLLEVCIPSFFKRFLVFSFFWSLIPFLAFSAPGVTFSDGQLANQMSVPNLK